MNSASPAGPSAASSASPAAGNTRPGNMLAKERLLIFRQINAALGLLVELICFTLQAVFRCDRTIHQGGSADPRSYSQQSFAARQFIVKSCQPLPRGFVRAEMSFIDSPGQDRLQLLQQRNRCLTVLALIEIGISGFQNLFPLSLLSPPFYAGTQATFC